MDFAVLVCYFKTLAKYYGAWWLSGTSGGSQVRIPLCPPCRDLGQVLHSWLPAALRLVNSDTVSVLCRESLRVVVELKMRYRNIQNEWMNCALHRFVLLATVTWLHLQLLSLLHTTLKLTYECI